MILQNLTVSAQQFAELLANSDDGLTNINSNLLECGTELYSKLSMIYTETATPQCGQNIAKVEMTSSYSCQPETSVNLWEMEKLFYNYDSPPSDFIQIAFVRQFTQLVWYADFVSRIIIMNIYLSIFFIY